MRDNERAAAAIGIDVRLAKLFAFSLAAVIASVGGMLMAFRFPQVIFTEYGLFDSIAAVTQTVVGGVGFIGGALGGGTLVGNGAASEAMPAIGRASCGERVGQYVEIEGGAGPVKQKIK